MDEGAKESRLSRDVVTRWIQGWIIPVTLHDHTLWKLYSRLLREYEADLWA
jgi:hypothetical protein